MRMGKQDGRARRRSRRQALVLACWPLILLLAGCGGQGSSTTTIPASITVSPTSASTVVGGNATFTATAVDSGGSQVTVTFLWASSAPTVATISSNGVASALTPGTTQITASASGVASSAVNLTVTPPVASVVVSPRSATIAVNGTQQFTAMAQDSSGNPLPGTSIAWFCSNAAVATINSSGLVTGISPGTVTIMATAGGVSSAPSMLTVQ